MVKVKRNSLFLIAVCTIALIFSVSLFRSFDNSRVPDDSFQALSNKDLALEQIEEKDAVVLKMLVDIKGAVLHPGVYEIDKGDRVVHAIAKAGGFLAEANQDAINLALLLGDEMVIYVPRVGEEAVYVSHVTINEKDATKININTATTEELQKIPGIGPAKASAILSYREETGKFKNISEIVNVPGIGQKTLEKITEFIVVK